MTVYFLLSRLFKDFSIWLYYIILVNSKLYLQLNAKSGCRFSGIFTKRTKIRRLQMSLQRAAHIPILMDVVLPMEEENLLWDGCSSIKCS